MACIDCGSKNSRPMKHIPLPNKCNGWIELTEWTEYCTDCATKESVKMGDVFNKSMEVKT